MTEGDGGEPCTDGIVGVFERPGELTCGRCHQPTGNANQGHYWAYCKAERRTRAFHFCCPGDCQLASPAGVDQALAEQEQRRKFVVDHLTTERDEARDAGRLTQEELAGTVRQLQAARAELGRARERCAELEAAEAGELTCSDVCSCDETCPIHDGYRPLDELLMTLRREVEQQDTKHGPYQGTVLGRSRLAIATLEDEVAEVLDAWRSERRIDGWPETRKEVLQVAAVAIRTLRDALTPASEVSDGR